MGLIQKVGVGRAWGRGIPSLTFRAFYWGARRISHTSPRREPGDSGSLDHRPHPAQSPVAFMISSVRMIATPISDSPAISPLDTGTV